MSSTQESKSSVDNVALPVVFVFFRPAPARRPAYRSAGVFPMLKVPPHLLHQIADQLDRPDAIALASTCSVLRPYGESSAWKELVISAHRSYLPTSDPPKPYPSTNPLGGDRLFRLRERYSWPEDGEVGAKREDELKGYYTDLQAILGEHPDRLKSVRRVYIDIDRLLSPECADLLRLVSPTLTTLHLIPPGFPYHLRTHFSTKDLLDNLSSMRFYRLRELYLPLSSKWDDLATAALNLVPNLRSLILHSEEPFCGAWGDSTAFQPVEDPGRDWPALPCLRNLEVREMSDALVPLVMALVRGATRFERVSLQDPAKAWSPAPGCELFKLLSRTTLLTRIACPLAALPLTPGDGYDGVESALTTSNEAVTLPVLPSVKAIYSYSPSQSDMWSIAFAWNGEVGGLPAAIRSIPPEFAFAVNNSPSLVFVQLPCFIYNEWQIPLDPVDWAYWGSEQCWRDHGRGILIRTYTTSSAEEVFMHCRSYSAHFSHIDNQLIYRAESVWEEHVDYGGLVVPAGILAEVYALLGESAGWQVPGRDLDLPEAAWGVLRRWSREQKAKQAMPIIHMLEALEAHEEEGRREPEIGAVQAQRIQGESSA